MVEGEDVVDWFEFGDGDEADLLLLLLLLLCDGIRF